MPKWTKKEDIERILRVKRRLRWKNVPEKQIEPASYLSRDCPVCGSTKKTLNGTRSISSPTDKGWYVFQHHDVQCNACDFHYSTNIPEPTYIDDYYKYAVARAAPDYNVQNRIEAIERLVSKGSRVLEYGAAQDEFVKVLREAGYIVDGVDVGDDIPDTDYDLICCYYTLEHLISPNAALETFNTLMKPGGLVIIEVPDYEKNVKASVHFQHFNHFTEAHLTQMLANNGFECVEIINAHSRPFGICYIGKKTV